MGFAQVTVSAVARVAMLCGALLVAAPWAFAQAQEARPDSARAAARRTAPAGSNATGAPGAAGAGAEASANAVQFSARDSLVMVFSDGENEDEGDVGTLYGNAEVNHQEATLTAYEVQMLLDQQELRAVGPPSEEAGAADTSGLPRFQRGGGEAFTGSELSFNMQTKRGRIVKARTGFQEGYVQGDAVRVDEDSTLYVSGGRYTTCNCPRGETPSYSLRSNKMKVQGKWVFTGPIQLYIFNIPMPFILPFAFLPATSGRRGGILPPSYGRDDRLGFYLRNFGYYWPISDYMDLQMTASLWSRGSWGLSPTFRYTRRYRYDGNLSVDYVRNIAGDEVDQDYLNKTTARIRWNHNQTFNPTMSLNANVNLASSTYRRVVSEDFEDNVTQRTSSSVNFRKRWNQGNQSLNITLSQSQNLSTGNANLTLPSLQFSQNSIQPFKRERRGPGEEERWYEKITTSYDGEIDNRFDFTPLTESGERVVPGIAWYNALSSQEKYRRATGDTGQRFDFGATHRIPVSASFHVPRYDLSITPNFNYREEWYTSTKRREVRPVEEVPGTDPAPSEADETVITRDEPGFFAAREMNFGVGTSTTFYGLFPVQVGPMEGLRHTVQPNLSFSYAPNYNADFFGRTRTYTDPETGEEIRYDITTGNRVGRSRAQSQLSFNLGNVFETKEVSIDSTGAEESETLRLLRLDARTSYNFAADSLRLSDIRIGARFPVLQTKFDVNADLDLTFSPYVYNDDGLRLNRLRLREPGLLPAGLTDFDVSIRTDFRGGEGGGGRTRSQRGRTGGGARGVPGAGFGGIGSSGLGPAGQRSRMNPGYSERASQQMMGTGTYANFAIPWSLGLRFSYGFTNRGRFEESTFLLNADFDFNITPRWKVSGRSGYDFSRGELTATRLNITRDFECWLMNFSWTPFGPRQSYSFSLRVKSSTLGDLLNLRLPRQGVRNRFGGVVSQVTQ